MNQTMYCYTQRFILFLGLLNSSLFSQEQPMLTEASSYKDTASYSRCIEQTRKIMAVIPRVMHELYMHEDYWKTQKLTPLAYFLSKDPTKWVYRKQEWQKIDSSLAFLAQEKEYHAYYLGLFKNLVADFEKDSSYSDKKFITHLELIEQFLAHYPHAAKVYNDQLETFEQRVNRNEYLIDYYHKNARKAVAHCSEPNHFQRNWLSYFCGSVALLGFSYFIYKNQSKLQMWTEMGWKGLKKYYHEHVSSPVVQSLKFLFNREREPLQTPEGVKSSKRAASRAAASFFEKRFPDLSQEQVKEIVDRTSIGDLDDTYIVWDKTIQELFDISKDMKSNSLLDKFKLMVAFFQNLDKILDLARMVDIRIQAKDLQVNKGMFEVEKQLNANVFNFEIAAVLPSALVAYFTYSLSKMLFTKFVLQKNIYQPLRKSLRHLQMIYTKYMNDNSALSVADEGFCYYWIGEFKRHSNTLLLNEQKSILEDLAELDSYDRTVTQKLTIIQRMYYTYHFLLPSSK